MNLGGDGGACSSGDGLRVEQAAQNIPKESLVNQERRVEERIVVRREPQEEATLHAETNAVVGLSGMAPREEDPFLTGSVGPILPIVTPSSETHLVSGPSSTIVGPQYYVEEPDSPREGKSISSLIGSPLLRGLRSETGFTSKFGEEGLSSVFSKALNLKRKLSDCSEEEDEAKKPRRIAEGEDGSSEKGKMASGSIRKGGTSSSRGRMGRGRGRSGNRSSGKLGKDWEVIPMISDVDLVDIRVKNAEGLSWEEAGGSSDEKALVAGLKQPRVQW